MQQPLFLLACLVRSLSHQIRTPLSVVSNEISYLSGFFPNGECERAFNACNNITNLLNLATSFDLPAGHSAEHPIADLGEELCAQFNCQLSLEAPLEGEGEGSHMVCFNNREWQQVSKLLSDLLIEKANLTISSVKLAAGSQGDRSIIRIEIDSSFLDLHLQSVCQSLADLFCFRLENDNIEAPLIDLILWANNARVAIYQSPRPSTSIDLSLIRAL